MPTKIKIDPEIKAELLIKLAFGIPIEQLMEEFNLPRIKIVNLRKNNYIRYNEFFEHWKIDKEVALLGLAPKYERALSITKKFYKTKIKILKDGSILYNDKYCSVNQLIDLADEILKKDGILNFKEMPIYIKNFY